MHRNSSGSTIAGGALSPEKGAVAEVLLTLLRKSDRDVYISGRGLAKREESVKKLKTSLGNPVLPEIYSGTAKKIMTEFLIKFAKVIYPDIKNIHEFFSKSRADLRKQYGSIPPVFETLVGDLNHWLELYNDNDRAVEFTNLRSRLADVADGLTKWEDQQKQAMEHKIDEAKFKDFLVFVDEIVSTAFSGGRQGGDAEIIKKFDTERLTEGLELEGLTFLKLWTTRYLRGAQQEFQKGQPVTSGLLDSFKRMVDRELETI